MMIRHRLGLSESSIAEVAAEPVPLIGGVGVLSRFAESNRFHEHRFRAGRKRFPADFAGGADNLDGLRRLGHWDGTASRVPSARPGRGSRNDKRGI